MMTYSDSRMLSMTDDELEHFNERAAILEFEAAMPRADAERLAMEAVIARRMSRMSAREQAVQLARSLRQ